jgi:hypothetical protein
MSVARRTLLPLVVAFVVAALPASARADVIVAVDSYSVSNAGFMNGTLFDSALGTLDSVHVSIAGVATIEALLPANESGTSFVGYPFQITFQEEFAGLGNGFFDFNGPSSLVFNGFSPGFASPLVLASAYQLDFALNQATDLIGFVIPATNATNATLIPPLTGVSGPRSAFVETPASIGQLLVTQSAFSQAAGPLPLITGIRSEGAMTVTYTYTPNPPVSPVAEPGSLTLIGVGVVGVFASRRRRSVPAGQ